MIMLSRLESVPAREVWTHEEYDFTPWLRDNIDVLQDLIGLPLEITAIEHHIGVYRLDMLGQDLQHGVPLVIENQLEPTDQSHLGQLLTYAAGVDAGTVVWVARDFRDEHRAALDWLNRVTNEDVRFFGVAVRVVRIDGSTPAPNFELAVAPSDWQKTLQRVATVSRSEAQPDVPRTPWTTDDAAVARSIWNRLTSKAQVIFERLMATPGLPVASAELVALAQLEDSRALAGALAWPGIYCKREAKPLFFRFELLPGGTGQYFMEPLLCELFLSAKAQVPQPQS